MTVRHEVIDSDTGLDDPGVISVIDLIGRLNALANRHGHAALLEFDAGHNNISVRVVKPVEELSVVSVPRPAITVYYPPGKHNHALAKNIVERSSSLEEAQAECAARGEGWRAEETR